MGESQALAHIAGDGRTQTVLEHLEGTAALCEQFAAHFGAGPEGRLAGMAHDLGKYSEEFQRRLHGSPERVDHSTAGASQCAQAGHPCAALAVMGHHGGLPDGGGRGDPAEASTFYGRLRRAGQGQLPNCEGWRRELALPGAPPPRLTDPLGAMFYTRMLYSCLVDADFLDTEAFMAGSPPPRGEGLPIEQLEQRLEQYTARWAAPKTALDRARWAVLQHCRQQGDTPQTGLFTLTVPTGGGKTVSSLAFALRHARAAGLRRVIYVIPYTSIIEQTAQIFREILGEENVLEHHSGILFDLEQEARPETMRLARAAENWDAPVVVTTAVQFFESLFANRSSQCRKLHNLAQSVILFDEAQMLPIPNLRPCVFAIAQLVRHYGVSAVLCTATQPALDGIFREFLPTQPPRELCGPELFDPTVFRRVHFQQEGELSWPELADRMARHGQALCILNSRKSARQLYALLPGEGAFHLSTLMAPAHRKAAFAAIRQRLKEGLPCRVVATSLIEAGVDVDFPAVFREEAGLDSVLQAAGRCNREGRRPAAESVVTVFRAPVPPPQLFAQPIASARAALRRFGQPDDPAAIGLYFRELLDLKGPQALDQKQILPTMARELMPFATVAERFAMIDSKTQTVYIPWGEGAALCDRLRSGERSRRLFRALGQYGVAVYPDHLARLDAAGALSLLEDGSAILEDLSLYTKAEGLSLEAEGGQALFL